MSEDLVLLAERVCVWLDVSGGRADAEVLHDAAVEARASLAAALEAKGDLVEGLGWILGMALHHPTEEQELLRGRLRAVSGKVESLIKSPALASKGENPLSARETQLMEALEGVVDRCESAFRQLGMDGPDKERMGEVWYDAYALCKAALLRPRGEKG